MRNCHIIFPVVVSFYTPINHAHDSNFCTSLPTLIFCSSDISHHNGCEFWFAFQKMLNIFSCSYWPFSISSLDKVSVQGLYPFLYQVVCCCCCWVLDILYIFWILIPYQIYNLPNIFSHSVSYLFTLLILSFDAQNFKFSWSPICPFFLL